MKVLCIDASAGFVSKVIPPFSEGDILDVVDDVDYNDGYVVLLNYGVYHKKRFAPLSNIDETKLIKEKQSSTLKGNIPCGHQ